MLLKYDSVYDLAEFPKDGKPSLKPEYWKTYYCVMELPKDFYSTANCGLMSKENRWYDRGYYVIPCYLSAHKWLCGDKVVLHYRQFCYLFGEPRMYEPQDVERDDWSVATDFKKYWGLVQTSLDHFGKIEDFELYTDVYEAIARARELDKLMSLTDKWKKVTSSLSEETRLYDNLYYKLKTCPAHTERQKLQHQISLMTQEKREKRIEKLSEEDKKLRDQMKKYKKYLQQ